MEKDKLFTELVESIDEIFWVTDWKTKKTIYVSPAYEKIYGLSCQSLYDNSKSWSEAIHPSDLKRVNDEYYSKAESGKYDIEFRILHPDGRIVWVNEKAYPIFENGELVRISGTTSDITAKKLVQLRQDVAYRISNAAQQVDLNLIDLAAIIHNEVRDIIDAENFYLAVFNQEEFTIDFPYFNDRSIKTKEDRLIYKKRRFEDGLTELVINTKKAFVLDKNNRSEFEKQIKNKNLTNTYSWMGVPLQVKGKIIGVIVAKSYNNDAAYNEDDQKFFHFVANQVSSIMGRINTAEDLKINELKYRSLFDKMNIGLMHSSKEGEIQFVNTFYARLTGYGVSELIGKNGYELLLDEKERARLKLKLKDKEKGISERYKARLIKKNGEEIWVKMDTTPNYNSKGEFIGVISLIKEVEIEE